MKKLTGLFTLAALVAAFQAQARTPAAAATKATGSTASYSNDSYAYSSESKNILSPSLGFAGVGYNAIQESDSKTGRMTLSGLFAIGVEYEYMLKDDFSIGGFIRYYNTSDTVAGTKIEETSFLLGPMAHVYLVNNANWVGYVGSGFTLLSLTQKQAGTSVSPSAGLGIPIAMGIAYKFTPKLSGGIEHNQVMALGSDLNGWPISDFLFRLRIAL